MKPISLNHDAVTLSRLNDSLQRESSLQIHERVVLGVPAAVAEEVRSSLNLISRKEFFEILDINPKKFERCLQSPNSNLDPATSDKLVAFLEIFHIAEDVFGNSLSAEKWLCEPAIGLSQRRPVDLMSTSLGYTALKELLTRIDHGVYS